MNTDKAKFIFPKWVDKLKVIVIVAGGVALVFLAALGVFEMNPRTHNVGYQPVQPVEYSHAMHAGELGIDCYYCHYSVEVAALAAIPPLQTCMNCHDSINTESEKTQLMRDSFETGIPIQWVKVHNLSDFVYFNHSAHLRGGIGCVTCHGRIDTMDVVYQAKSLGMAWCLECHRNPQKYIRPREFITSMTWIPDEDRIVLGERLIDEYGIKASTNCSTCHR